ncbi:MAG: hypothetical protein RL748_1651 [Pseudomonadota bacterium]|jgi:thiol:disulfide interchange protein DsbA
MRIVKHLMAAFSFGLLALSPAAFAAETKGLGYYAMTDPQPTDSGKKVEVIEFFGYACPHCFGFDPVLAAWVKKQGDQIVFKRIPANFRPEWALHARMYYALESMGKNEEMHAKIFNAMHGERQPLNTEDAIINFVAKHGIDKQKFTDAFGSFSVQAKVKRLAQMQANYKIENVPTIIIDGRYVTAPHLAADLVGRDRSEPELQQAALKIMDDLVAKSKKK